MDLHQAQEALTPEEVKALKLEIKAIKEKLPLIKNYLAHYKGLSNLPPGWLNVEKSFEAMENRVNLLDKAFAAGSIETGQDLALQTNPLYKIQYALTALYMLITTPKFNFRTTNGAIGFESLQTMIKALKARQVDIPMLTKWCSDPTLNLQKLRQKLLNTPELLGKYTDDKGYDQILDDAKKLAAIDLKDTPRQECERLYELLLQ